MSHDDIRIELNSIKLLVESNIQQHSAHYSDVLKHLSKQDERLEQVVKKIEELSPVSRGVRFFNGARDLAVFLTPYGILLTLIMASWKWITNR